MKQLFARLRNIQALMPLLVVGVLMVAGAVVYNFNAHAATAGFSFTVPSASYNVGDTFEVAVYETSDTQCANVVKAEFNYPAELLRYNSASATDSKFEAVLPTDSGNGTVSMQQYTTRKECGSGSTATSGVIGEQLIGRVSFTVLKSGTAALNFTADSTAISSSDNKTNVASGSTGQSLTLVDTATPADPASVPAPTAAPTPPSIKLTPRPVTAFTPLSTGTTIPLNDKDAIELKESANVNPLPIQPDGVNKIEYYLGGKLVATVKSPPYTYRLDTSNMLNGNYELVTKTYYTNGQFKTVSQTVVVNNKFGLNQLKLAAKKYAWLIILVGLVIAAAITAYLIRRGRGGNGPWSGHQDDDSYHFDNVQPGSFRSDASNAESIQPDTSFTSPEPTVVAPAATTPTEAPSSPTVAPTPSNSSQTPASSDTATTTAVRSDVSTSRAVVTDDGANIIQPTESRDRQQ